MKQMMRTLQEDREIVLFVDLHGHSRKHNIFCYGCEPKVGLTLTLTLAQTLTLIPTLTLSLTHPGNPNP